MSPTTAENARSTLETSQSVVHATADSQNHVLDSASEVAKIRPPFALCKPNVHNTKTALVEQPATRKYAAAFFDVQKCLEKIPCKGAEVLVSGSVCAFVHEWQKKREILFKHGKNNDKMIQALDL